MDKVVFNIKEAAEYLNVSVPLLRKLVSEHGILFFRIGKKIMFKKDSLDKWIREKENKESNNNIFGV